MLQVRSSSTSLHLRFTADLLRVATGLASLRRLIDAEGTIKLSQP